MEKPLPPSNSFLMTKEKHFGFFPNFFFTKKPRKKNSGLFCHFRKKSGLEILAQVSENLKIGSLSWIICHLIFFPVTGWSSLSWASKWIHNYVETPVEETFAKYAGKYSSLQSYIVHNLRTNRCTAVAQSVEHPLKVQDWYNSNEVGLNPGRGARCLEKLILAFAICETYR